MRLFSVVCWLHGHNDFKYAAHTGFPKEERAVWCGRCGRETTIEAEERERIAQAEAIFEYMQRRSRYY